MISLTIKDETTGETLLFTNGLKDEALLVIVHSNDTLETLEMVARDAKRLIDGKFDLSSDPDFFKALYANCMEAIEKTKG